MASIPGLEIIIPGSAPNPTIQSAINSATVINPPVQSGAVVWIPPDFDPAQTYTNPSGVIVFDMRPPGSISIAAGGSDFYQTIEQAGSALTQRPTLNFASGVTCVDNAGATRTDCTATGGGAGNPAAPVNSIQFNSASSFGGVTGALTDGKNIYSKGPSPTFDILAYEPIPGTTCPSTTITTGTITSGSHTLALASAAGFTAGCGIAIAGAGANPTASAPSGVTATYNPPTQYLVSANSGPGVHAISCVSNVCTATAVAYHYLTVGDSVTISGVTGFAHTSPNTTVTVASLPSLNQFTFALTTADETGDGGTFVEHTGSTSRSYKVTSVDILAGQSVLSSAATVSNGAANLTWATQNIITVPCATNAVMYGVWQTAPSTRFLGMAPLCYNGNPTTTIPDYGQTNISNTTWMSSSLPTGTVGQVLVTTITAGGGTTSLTLAAAASNNATAQNVWHDDTAAIKAAIVASQAAGGGTIYQPNGSVLRFGDLGLTGTYTGWLKLKFDGVLFPWMTMNFPGQGPILEGDTGTGELGGLEASAFQTLPASIIEPDSLNPVIFWNGGAPVISNIFIGTILTRSIGTSILLASSEQPQLFNVVLAGFVGSIGPSLKIDGCPFGGEGATFNTKINQINVNTPTSFGYGGPGVVFNCVGTAQIHDGFLDGGGILLQATLPLASGGGVEFANFEPEALTQPFLTTDWTNYSNDGGITLTNCNVSDALVSPNILLLNPVSANSGHAIITDSIDVNVLIAGQPYSNGIAINGPGPSFYGAQLGNLYSVDTPSFKLSAPIGNTALQIIQGAFQIGSNTSGSSTNYVVDQTNGSNSITGLGTPLWIWDSAAPSQSFTYHESANGADWIERYISPNRASDFALTVSHANNWTQFIQNANNTFFFGQSTSPFTAGGWSFPAEIGIGGFSNPTRLISSASAARAATFPDATGTVGVITGSPTTGHLAAITISGGVTTLTDGGAPLVNPMTTAGDIIYGGASGVATRLPAGTAHQLLHSGSTPSWSAVSLTADVSGITPVANGGLGIASGTSGGIACFTGTTTIASSTLLGLDGVLVGGGAGACPSATAAGSSGQVLTSNGAGNAPTFQNTTGSGTVNNGTTNQLAYYASSTTAVSGLSLPADTQIYVLTGTSAGTPVWSLPGVPFDAQTGTTYAWPSADRNELLTTTNSGAIAVSLAQAGTTGFTNNFHSALMNLGTGLVTVTPATSTINGASTQIVPKNWVGYLYSNDTNYLMPVVPSLTAFPSCQDTAGQHLNINTSTGAISCGTSTTTLTGTTGSIGGGLLTVGTCTSGTATVTGATTSMVATASPVTYPGDGNYWVAYVSSSNTVTVKVCATATLTPSASNYNVRVAQ